ncbi:hypothetical protein RB195_006610 [Necator americanus]|uniref:Uncharacterized protein n=1 Tax=Necator americanus TaxID=51031 RepID=A0ABR1BTG1_NECAM
MVRLDSANDRLEAKQTTASADRSPEREAKMNAVLFQAKRCAAHGWTPHKIRSLRNQITKNESWSLGSSQRGSPPPLSQSSHKHRP